MCFFKNFFSIEEKSNLFLLQKKIKQKIPQNNVFWSLINFFLHPNISYDVKTRASLKYFDNRKLILYASNLIYCVVTARLVGKTNSIHRKLAEKIIFINQNENYKTKNTRYILNAKSVLTLPEANLTKSRTIFLSFAGEILGLTWICPLLISLLCLPFR